MGDLSTYSLGDFFPITRNVYFRLFVRHNETVWPAHIAAVLAGIAAVWLAVRGRGRIWGPLVGLAWVSVGWTFHLNLYANMNWGATYAGWGFVVQGLLLVGYGLPGRLDRSDDQSLGAPGWTGVVLAGFALAVFPLIGPLAGRAWAGIRVFGIAPNPTVIATIGLLSATERPRWLLFVIPVLWCLIAAATGIVMEAPSELVTAGAGIVGLSVGIWKRLATDGGSPTNA